MACSSCGCEVFEIVLTPTLKHHAKEVCSECGRYIKWVPNPKTTRRRSTTKVKVDYTNGCLMCGRDKTELGLKRILVVHHWQPLSEGGQDVKENVAVVCSACHSMIHWLRNYLQVVAKAELERMMVDENI